MRGLLLLLAGQFCPGSSAWAKAAAYALLLSHAGKMEDGKTPFLRGAKTNNFVPKAMASLSPPHVTPLGSGHHVTTHSCSQLKLLPQAADRCAGVCPPLVHLLAPTALPSPWIGKCRGGQRGSGDVEWSAELETGEGKEQSLHILWSWGSNISHTAWGMVVLGWPWRCVANGGAMTNSYTSDYITTPLLWVTQELAAHSFGVTQLVSNSVGQV